MSDRTRLHFARFEFKYILPNKLREELEAELGYFLELDPYVKARSDNKYYVRSLYYDDDAYTCYFDKKDGLKTRSKFRIRTYCSEPDAGTPAFLEIKGRHNNLVFKHRTPIGSSADYANMTGDKLSNYVLTVSPQDDKVRAQFEYELLRKRLKPVALINYQRRPYISKYDPEFRLTFDENLTGTISNSLFPSRANTEHVLLPGYTVLEVKFRYHVPSWFHRIIQAYELRRVSVSKICLGMERLNLVDDIS